MMWVVKTKFWTENGCGEQTHGPIVERGHHDSKIKADEEVLEWEKQRGPNHGTYTWCEEVVE